MRRTPGESVPSMQAGVACWWGNSWGCCSCRRACKASCAAWGRRCSTLPVGRRVRTLSARRTPLADLRRKHHFDALPRQAPALTELSLWTDCLLRLPVQLKVRQVEALAGFGLPTVIGEHRTPQAAAILLPPAAPQA